MTNRNKILDSFGGNLSSVLFNIYFSKYILVDLLSMIPIMTISKAPPNTAVNRKIMISKSPIPGPCLEVNGINSMFFIPQLAGSVLLCLD